jgi:ABC-type sugar transport system permease subunit
MGRRRWEILTGWVFSLPWVVYFAVFLAWPALLAVKMSFLDLNVAEPGKTRFTGIGNWIRAALDPLFWKSLFNIIYNQSVFIALTFVISLGAALLMTKVTKGAGLFRTVYFLPVVTSVTAAMILFDYLVSPTGPIQKALVDAGVIGEPVNWTFTKWLPMPLLAVFNSWKWFAVHMMIFLGGLLAINRELYEAAEVDGAGPWTRLTRITLPLLKPQILFVLTMNVIYGMQMFTEVFMIFDLSGGPYQAGLTPVLYLYRQGFDRMEMGYASALGLLLALVILVLTVIQWNVINRKK